MKRKAKKLTQCDRILEYMNKYGEITPLDSWNKCGVYRLAARISDLKRRGYCIEKNMVTRKNRFGEKCRVASYRKKGETS